MHISRNYLLHQQSVDQLPFAIRCRVPKLSKSLETETCSAAPASFPSMLSMEGFRAPTFPDPQCKSYANPPRWASSSLAKCLSKLFGVLMAVPKRVFLNQSSSNEFAAILPAHTPTMSDSEQSSKKPCGHEISLILLPVFREFEVFANLLDPTIVDYPRNFHRT